MRYVQDCFLDELGSTIGASFLSAKVVLPNCVVKLEIWDTAGQERYRSLAPIYYRGAAAAIVVYDITDPDTLSSAKTWITELRMCDNNILIALVCNKIDLKQMYDAQGKKYCQENNLLYFETSAKTGYGVNNVFETIAEKVPKYLGDVVMVDINQKDIQPLRKKSCC